MKIEVEDLQEFIKGMKNLMDEHNISEIETTKASLFKIFIANGKINISGCQENKHIKYCRIGKKIWLHS